MSHIDPSKPVEGTPTTQSVRDNFATAKAEIESLQAQQSAEVSIFGFMTQQQITDHRAGTLSFDEGAILQQALTYAAGLVAVADNDIGVMVRVPGGKGQIQTAATVPAKVSLVCDGFLINNLASGSANPIIFAPGAHCTRLLLDANGKMGALFGTATVDARSRIGDILVKNVDGVGGVGVRFLGNLFTFNSIRVEGGLIGVDFGNGGVNEARQVNGNIIYAYNNKTGVRFDKASLCSVARVITDSNNTSGLQIDRSHDLALPNVLCYWNDGVAGTKFSASALNVGTNSVSDPVTGLILKARCVNTATVCAQLSYTQKSDILIDGMDSLLPTGNANPSSNIVVAFNTGYDGTNVLAVQGGAVQPWHTGAPIGSYRESGSPDQYFGPAIFWGYIANGAGTTVYSSFDLPINTDQSFANQVTPQAVGLNVSVNAGETWFMEADMDIGDALATTGVKVQFITPTMTAIQWSASLVPDVYAAANVGYGRIVAANGILTFAAANQVGVGAARLRLRARFIPSANGTISFAIAQATSSGTNVTLKAGSLLRARRLS